MAQPSGRGPKPSQTMAEIHAAEIQGIIDACEASVAHHKAIAYWDEASGAPEPVGRNPAAISIAVQAISVARAKCAKDIAAATERHRAESATLEAPAAEPPEEPDRPAQLPEAEPEPEPQAESHGRTTL